MHTLQAGQNVELSQRNLRFYVAGRAGGVAALLLNEQRHFPSHDHYVSTVHVAHHAGVSIPHAGTIDINTDAIPPAIAHILCVATEPSTKELACRLTGEGDDITFMVDAAGIHPATICFELYRRDNQWKARAVGQGYAGGLDDLLRAHYRPPCPTPSSVAQTESPTPGPAPVATSVQPLGDNDPLERIAMIHEDAARVTAALLAAHHFAATRRDNEMSAAVADQAARAGAAAQQAMANAQRRYGDLMARARSDYERDTAHLIAELTALDTELPPSLASWEATAWQHTVRSPTNGIRLGTVTVPEAGELTVPFCVAAPLQRPIWLDTLESSAAAPVAASVVLRLLAAATQHAATLDIIDVTGSLKALWQPLASQMPRSVVTEPSEISPRLQYLVNQADLATLRRQTSGAVAPGGVILITDVGYAMSAQDITDIVALINAGTEANLSIVFSGNPHWENAVSIAVLRDIADHCLHIPVDGYTATLLDPWTHSEWQFRSTALTINNRLNEISAALTPTFLAEED